MKRTPSEWNNRYETKDLPWDTGRPDQHLVQLVENGAVTPGRTLEIGCGTGTNSIWLAQRGFAVTGLDVAPLAIERAREKARSAGAAAEFHVLDLLNDDLPRGPYSFVFDRGCFHSFDTHDERARIARRVAEVLCPDGLWFLLIGSTDGPPRDSGPPRLAAADIAAAVETDFEILNLDSTVFDSNSPVPARAWTCLLRKRTVYNFPL